MLVRPRLLDLFSGAGGCAVGYARAGFEVVGVDIKPQPRYPFEFHQADALTFPLDGYDAIHASPPCQAFVRSGMFDHSRYTDQLTPMRARLTSSTRAPWVIENVPGAPMRRDVILCGSMFGLGVRRHRWFETSWPIPPWVLACLHTRRPVGVYGHPRGNGRNGRLHDWGHGTKKDWERAMGIDWMRDFELSQAIPPAYTEWIGRRLIAALQEEAA